MRPELLRLQENEESLRFLLNVCQDTFLPLPTPTDFHRFRYNDSRTGIYTPSGIVLQMRNDIMNRVEGSSNPLFNRFRLSEVNIGNTSNRCVKATFAGNIC